MSYVLAWIIVGFCSFLINKNNWEKQLGKYGMAIWAHCRIEGDTEQLTPDDAIRIRRAQNITAAIFLTALAPFGVWVALRTSFTHNKINDEVIKVVNEYASKHGMIF